MILLGWSIIVILVIGVLITMIKGLMSVKNTQY